MDVKQQDDTGTTQVTTGDSEVLDEEWVSQFIIIRFKKYSFNRTIEMFILNSVRCM
jgi:hypothetical protein